MNDVCTCRRLSNRESARRTRLRRNSEMAKLRGSNEALQQDCEIMRAQLADLAAANQALLASIPRLADQKQQCAPLTLPSLPCS